MHQPSAFSTKIIVTMLILANRNNARNNPHSPTQQTNDKKGENLARVRVTVAINDTAAGAKKTRRALVFVAVDA